MRDEVNVLLCHVVVRGEVPFLELLAARKCQHAVATGSRTRRRRGAQAAHGTRAVGNVEAIEVLPVGIEACDVHVH